MFRPAERIRRLSRLHRFAMVPARRGWFINFPNTGQRMVYPMDFLINRFVTVDTISPANVSLDPCVNTTGGTGYLYFIDALTGGGPVKSILDTNGDGQYDTRDSLVAGLLSSADGRNVTLSKGGVSGLNNPVSRGFADTSYGKTSGIENFVTVSGGQAGGIEQPLERRQRRNWQRSGLATTLRQAAANTNAVILSGF